MPSLYVVSTPIGNLEDITLRAIRTLNEVALIAAEDTRNTRKLLTYYDIHTPLTSFHQNNIASKLPTLINTLSEHDIALVSAAGTPIISDPGSELIKAASKNEISVISIPGPSAVTSAVALSGMPGDRFSFLGFLPRRNKERDELIRNVEHLQHPLVFFEAPHRLIRSLRYISDELGNRKISILREMTKFFEEGFYGDINSAIDHFINPVGEFTIVIEGNIPLETISEEQAGFLLSTMIQSGLSLKEARESISIEHGISKKTLYRIWLDSTKSV